MTRIDVCIIVYVCTYGCGDPAIDHKIKLIIYIKESNLIIICDQMGCVKY